MQQSWDAANGSPQVRLAETAGSEALYGVYCRQLNIKMDSLNVKKKKGKKKTDGFLLSAMLSTSVT